MKDISARIVHPSRKDSQFGITGNLASRSQKRCLPEANSTLDAYRADRAVPVVRKKCAELGQPPVALE